MTYTIDNPKLVSDIFSFEGVKNFSGVVKDKNNNIYYYLNGKWHREDGPACEYGNGNKAWCLNDVYYGKNYDFTNESWIRFVQLELLK